MSERANGWQPQQLKLHMFSVSDSESPGVSFQLRGLMTERDIYPGQDLITVPKQLVITKAVAISALDSQLISSHNLTSHQMLAIFLVVEKSKGEGSTWYPYIQSLPQTYETPCFASKGEASCFPSFLKRIDSTQRHLIQRKYSQCRQSLVQTATMSFNDFRWAWITVNSRGVYSPDGSDNLALVPFLDMFNHSPEVSVKAETLPNGSYNIVNLNKTYRPGDQVMINYGPHNNITLYSEYGFLLSDNADDHLPLHLRDLVDVAAQFLGKQVLAFQTQTEVIEAHSLDQSLGIDGSGSLSWNIGACLFILANETCDPASAVSTAFQCEDFLKPAKDNADILLMSDMVVENKKAQLIRSIKSTDNLKANKKSASFQNALHLMKLYLEILERASKSLKRSLNIVV